MFAGPLGRFLGLEVILVGRVMVGGGRQQISVATLAGGCMGLHMTSEFVRARETLVAVGEVARVGLFARVGANMTSLMF